MITRDHAICFARHYTSVVDSAEDLGGFHNHVYDIKGSQNFILRVASSQHRSLDDTAGEIDYLLYLKRNGASVAEPIQGLNGEYAFASEQTNRQWIVSAFSIAEGADWRGRGCDEGQRLVQIGKELGRIHKLSKDYKPNGIPLRRQWYESQHLVRAQDLFQKYEPRLSEVFASYLDEMRRLPCEDDGFGLIHGDFLFSNYHIDGNAVVVFDFDECEYSWFVYDIAVCMYYYLLGGNPSELGSKKEEAEEMLYSLLTGYLQENALNIFWIQNIDFFFKMRDFVLLSTILEDFPMALEGWQKSFFDGAMDRVLNHKAFVEADFARVYRRCVNEQGCI